MNLRLFDGSSLIVAAGALVLVLGCATLVQCSQLETAETKRDEATKNVERIGRELDQEKSNRAEDQRRYLAQKAIADEAVSKASEASAAASAASASSGRLLRRLDALAARARQATDHPAAASGGPAASDADLVLADMFSRLVGRARRLVDRTGQLADIADQRGIAGNACERSYDALNNAQGGYQ